MKSLGWVAMARNTMTEDANLPEKTRMIGIEDANRRELEERGRTPLASSSPSSGPFDDWIMKSTMDDVRTTRWKVFQPRIAADALRTAT